MLRIGRITLFLTATLLATALLLPSCAHLSDTCDTYCIRHGGQCSGVDYGTRVYNSNSGEFKDKPTFFHCKFIN